MIRIIFLSIIIFSVLTKIFNLRKIIIFSSNFILNLRFNYCLNIINNIINLFNTLSFYLFIKIL